MELTQLALLAFAFLLLAIILIGSGIALQRSKNQKEGRRIAQAKAEILSGPVAEDPAPPAVTDSASGPGVSGPLEILRVYREPVDGRLALKLAGRPAARLADLDPEQAEQLGRVLAELRDWVELPPEKPIEEAPAWHPPEPEGTQALMPGSFAESLPPPVELGDILPFRRKKIPKLDSAPEPPKPIAEQINDIVQRMLAGSPLTGRGIRLSQDLHGGLRILDGDRQYEAIDRIEDPQVQALIMAAVREWNERNRPRTNPGGGPGT